MSERPTPLTDNEAMQTHGTPLAHYVRAEFARDIERKLDERDEQLAEARTALEGIRDCNDAPDIDATGEWQTGLFCGVEDRGCQDRYEGAEYGHTVGVEKALEWASNEATAALALIDAKGTA